MTLTLLVAKIYSIMLLFIGISIAFLPDLWANFAMSFKKKKYGAMGLAMAFMPFALLIMLAHPIWELTPTVIITIFAWMGFAKCLGYLFFPHWPYKMKMFSTEAKLTSWYRKWGPIIVILGAVLVYFTFVDVSPVYDETDFFSFFE